MCFADSGGLHVVYGFFCCTWASYPDSLFRSSATNNTTSGSIADTVSNAANYVKETVQEYTSASSKEANKQQMKNSNESLGDRASAGLSAASDKIEESGHSAKADAHKETAKH